MILRYYILDLIKYNMLKEVFVIWVIRVENLLFKIDIKVNLIK